MSIRRWILFIAGVLAASPAMAQSALVGKRLIAKGDDVERVRDAGGEPDRIDRIEADAGEPPMQIWSYARRGRTVTLWIVGERVVKVVESIATRN
jgi:hypothetical protein